MKITVAPPLHRRGPAPEPLQHPGPSIGRALRLFVCGMAAAAALVLVADPIGTIDAFRPALGL